MKIIGFKTEPS